VAPGREKGLSVGVCVEKGTLKNGRKGGECLQLEGENGLLIWTTWKSTAMGKKANGTGAGRFVDSEQEKKVLAIVRGERRQNKEKRKRN